MSGTSQAAAVTTGVVALMLQADPSLTPDTVKCRLLASTRPAITNQGKLAYSVFQQGAGLINAVAAVNSSATGCANRGLNLQADLDDSAHFGGPANIDDHGNYVIMDMDGTDWGDTVDADGYHLVEGLHLEQGLRVERGLYLEQGLHLVEGLHLEQGVYLVERLHLEQGLHLEARAWRGGKRCPRAAATGARSASDRFAGCRTNKGLSHRTVTRVRAVLGRSR